MPKSPRILASLSIANGLLTLMTAIVFANGRYGALLPQNTDGFNQVGGSLIAFAAVAFISFAVASLRERFDVVASLAAVVALGNGAALISPFFVPETLHMFSILFSSFLFVVTVGHERQRLEGWPARLILLGSTVGGLALVGVGRYEQGPNASAAIRGIQLGISVLGLVAFASGTVALAAGRGVTRPEAMR